jgi:hypothetical protein
MTNFWLRDSLCRDRCASAHLPTSCNRESFLATYQICTATRVMLNKICNMTAKTRAISSFSGRMKSSAKEPGSARCLRRVTQPPFIAGPLAVSDLAWIDYFSTFDKKYC